MVLYMRRMNLKNQNVKPSARNHDATEIVLHDDFDTTEREVHIDEGCAINATTKQPTEQKK